MNLEFFGVDVGEFLLATVVLIVGIFAINWYKYNKSSKVTEVKTRETPQLEGPQGRKDASGRAMQRLKSFASANGYELIRPGRIAQGTGVTDFDAIVVGTFGVLAVRSMGYEGQVYGNAKDTLWTQATKNGKVTFKNPLLQAEAEARMLREGLFAAKLKNVPVETLCVFPNNATELAVPRSTPVYRLKEFSALLKKDHFTEDRKVDIDKVAKALRDAMED